MREKMYYKIKAIRLTDNFSVIIMESKKQGDNTSKVLREHVNLKLYI